MPPSYQAHRIYEDTEDWSNPSAIMPLKHHKRAQSAADGLHGRPHKENHAPNTQPFLPLDPPHASHQRPLGERRHNVDESQSPQRPQKVPTKPEEGRPGLHKKTKSTVSLKSLLKDKDKSSDAGSASSPDGINDQPKPKKTKSSTNLAALFSKRSIRGRRNENTTDVKDKENTTPPSSAGVAAADHFPIWAQYATKLLEDQQSKVQIPPMRRGRTVEEEINLYTPKTQSSQQSALAGYPVPTLRNRPELKPRPKSDHITSRKSVFTEGLEATGQHQDPHTSRHARKVESHPTAASRPQSSYQPASAEQKQIAQTLAAPISTNTKGTDQGKSTNVSSKDIEGAFEEHLESRNIPHNMRDKMRSLDTNIKADFIKKNRVDSGSSAASGSSFAGTGKMRPSSRSPMKEDPVPRGRDNSVSEEKRSRSRPRSRGFTLTKKDGSPSKKQKEASLHGRPISVDMSRPGSSTSLTASPSLQGMSPGGRPDNAASPDDFIHYLREVQKPELVEVGKLHKLRLLLRNETVAWVDLFISKGGMSEVVALLYRIIDVEWRFVCTTTLNMRCD